MASIQELMERFKRGPTDVVGLDVGATGVKAVRMRKGDEISVLAADILPPIDHSDPDVNVSALDLPSKLKAKYACMTVTGQNAVVKILSFPGQFTDESAGKIVDSMGLDEPDNYRVSYSIVTQGHGKSESRVLAVALENADAAAAIGLLSSGLPAPFSLEVAGIATMTAFLNGPGADHADEAVGMIDFGSEVSVCGLFNKNALALVRTFPVGTSTLLNKVQESLGVDNETARGIVADGAFDISQSVSEVMDPLIKQLLVSRDFVERRENCHVSKLYASGGLVVSRDSFEEMHSAMGIDIDTWNPFDKLTVQDDAIPENLAGQESRFAAAVGAVLGTFEAT